MPFSDDGSIGIEHDAVRLRSATVKSHRIAHGDSCLPRLVSSARLTPPRTRSYHRHACAMRLTPLDLAIIVIYLIGVTLFGIAFRRGQSTVRDYFLGGRTAPWWALALSIVATETSTLTIIGTPALAFAGNMTFLQLVLGYLVGRVVIVLVFLPHYLPWRILYSVPVDGKPVWRKSKGSRGLHVSRHARL